MQIAPNTYQLLARECVYKCTPGSLSLFPRKLAYHLSLCFPSMDADNLPVHCYYVIPESILSGVGAFWDAGNSCRVAKSSWLLRNNFCWVLRNNFSYVITFVGCCIISFVGCCMVQEYSKQRRCIATISNLNYT